MSRPFFYPFLMNWRFALYLFVHGKRWACLIEYLCASIFAPFIWVDEFHLWIISYLTSVRVEKRDAVMSILQAIIVSYFTLDIWEFYF